jgi:hypothetical protein
VVEVTVICSQRPTRVLRFAGLYESAEDMADAITAKHQTNGQETYEYAIVTEIPEHRDNVGEYELLEPAEGSSEPVRAWAIHTGRHVTVRSADYAQCLKLYFLLLHGNRGQLFALRTERDRLAREVV